MSERKFERGDKVYFLATVVDNFPTVKTQENSVHHVLTRSEVVAKINHGHNLGNQIVDKLIELGLPIREDK